MVSLALDYTGRSVVAGDGVLTKAEFDMAPWTLQGETVAAGVLPNNES